MIFGFNTDINLESTVYHVQTELRGQSLESQVYVAGRCIGKHRRTVTAEGDDSAAQHDSAQELVRSQHRWIVDAIRQGFVDDVLNQETVQELVVQFLGSARQPDGAVHLRFRILSGGLVASGVHVEAGWKNDTAQGDLEPQTSDSTGVAEMKFDLSGEGSAELEVRVQLDTRHASRRFLVKSLKS